MIPGNHGRRCSLYSGVCVLLTMHALSHMHTHTCIHARTRTHTHNTRIGPTCVHTHYFSHTHIHTHTYTHRWVGYWCADMSTRIKQSKVTNVISFLSHTHAHTYIHTHTHTGGRDIGAPTCQTRIKAITSNECNFFSPFQFFFWRPHQIHSTEVKTPQMFDAELYFKSSVSNNDEGSFFSLTSI